MDCAHTKAIHDTLGAEVPAANHYAAEIGNLLIDACLSTLVEVHDAHVG
jgi:hypothetical protein